MHEELSERTIENFYNWFENHIKNIHVMTPNDYDLVIDRFN